jgi:chromate transporter
MNQSFNGSVRLARLREVALLFLRLGFTAFGGPAVHTAMMEDEAVRRREWLDRTHFLDLVAALNFIPGPNSTELAIQLGYLRAGFPGLVVAGFCFILPAVLIILPIAWAYVRYGSIPQVQGMLEAVNAAVVALLLVMVVRLARTALKDVFTGSLAAAALAASILMEGRVRFQPELAILATAALLGAMRNVWKRRDTAVPAVVALPLGSSLLSTTTSAAGTAAAAAAGSLVSPSLLALFLVFLKIGGTLFGSGYVLVSYLRTEMVEQRSWLTTGQLLDAVAVGQITPGPLLTTATFIGYLLGDRLSHGSVFIATLGALVATAGIFLPSFVLVAITGPLLPRLRSNPNARDALDAMNAAVVALILFVTLELIRRAVVEVSWQDQPMHFAFHPFSAAIATGAFVALVRFNVNATWVILAAAAAGLFRGMP